MRQLYKNFPGINLFPQKKKHKKIQAFIFILKGA